MSHSGHERPRSNGTLKSDLNLEKNFIEKWGLYRLTEMQDGGCIGEYFLGGLAPI